MLGFIAGTEKQARSFGPHVISDVQIPHQRSIPGKEFGVAGDEQVSTKAFQGEWSEQAAKMPGPSACGIDDDASTDFAMRRSDTTHDRSVKDQGFTAAVSDDLKAGASGLFQQIGQQRMDINDAIGGAEERVVKLKPAQKRETLPRLGSCQQFGGYAPFVQLRTPFGGSVWLTMNQVQTPGLAEDRASSNLLRTKLTNAFNGELEKRGIRLQLARHRGVAAGRVASGQQLPFENQAARHAGSRQRCGN